MLPQEGENAREHSQRRMEETRHCLDVGDTGFLVPLFDSGRILYLWDVERQDSPAMIALVVKKTWLTGTTVVIV